MTLPPFATAIRPLTSAQHQEFETRFDIFEPGDLTALICIDQPEYQQEVVESLSFHGLQNPRRPVPGGYFSLKLKTHVYDVVVIDEHFNGCYLGNNTVLYEAINLPSNQRRNQFSSSSARA